MKVTDYIVYTINRLPKRYVFTYEDFITAVNKKEAVIKGCSSGKSSGKSSEKGSEKNTISH